MRRIFSTSRRPARSPAPPGTSPYATIKANRSLHDRLFFPVRLDGHAIAALIDTGAQLTALDADSAATFGVTGAALARDPVANLARRGGRNSSNRARTASRGSKSTARPCATRSSWSTRLGLQDADLVLGGDFLRWQRVWLSYASHQIFLERRS